MFTLIVSLDYEISLPRPSPYHTSQQAAELVFESTMKRWQKREKSNFEKLTSLMLDFAKKSVGKIADFGLQFPFNGINERFSFN